MQSDPVIWQIINRQFCSFKVVMREQKSSFCRNPYNVNGLCNRSSCPLANSRYATVREEDGVIYLYIKTIERAHTPKNLWEKIPLHHTYTGALGQIDEQLMHWPTKQVHKVKQRLTRLHQYLIRMKKLLTRTSFKLTAANSKLYNRERAREKKALVAARLDFAIKKELLDRLKNNTYGDLYNIHEKVFQEVMDSEGQNEVEYIEADDELDAELEAEAEAEDMEDFNEDDNAIKNESSEDEEDFDMGMQLEDGGLEDPEEQLKYLQNQLKKKIKKKRKSPPASTVHKDEKKKKLGGAKVEVEFEEEHERGTTTSSSSSW